MPIVETLSKYRFIDGCKQFSQFEDWPYAVLEALYEELDALDDEPLEFDPIAYACDWECCTADSEEELIEDLLAFHVLNLDEEDKKDLEKVIEALRDKTQVVEFDGGVLVAAY